MELPVSDLLDRLSIVELKFKHLADDVTKELRTLNLEYQCLAATHPNWDLPRYMEKLREINAAIWEQEADTRSLQAHINLTDRDYIKIGKAALKIRNFNRERCRIKNQIVDITATGFPEVKVNHCSE